MKKNSVFMDTLETNENDVVTMPGLVGCCKFVSLVHGFTVL